MLPLTVYLNTFKLNLILPIVSQRLTRRLPFMFRNNPSNTQDFLDAVTATVVSVANLIFSVAVIILRLTDDRFAPEILTSFLADQVARAALNIFATAFVCSLAIVQSIHNNFRGSGPFIPRTSIAVTFIFIITDIKLFLTFVHRVAESVRITGIITRVDSRSIHVISSLCPRRTSRIPANDHA